MIAALAAAMKWSMRGDVGTFTGAKPLRFRLASH